MKLASLISERKKSIIAFAVFSVAVMLLPNVSAFFVDDMTVDVTMLPETKTWSITDSGQVNLKFINIVEPIILLFNFTNIDSTLIGTQFSNFGTFNSTNSMFIEEFTASDNNVVYSFSSSMGMTMVISNISKSELIEGMDDMKICGNTYPGKHDASQNDEYRDTFEDYEMSFTIPDSSILHALDIVTDDVISFFAITNGSISKYDMMNDNNTPYEPAFPLLLPIGTEQVTVRSTEPANVEIQLSTSTFGANDEITDLSVDWLGIDNDELTSDINNQIKPQICVDANSNTHVVWADYRSGGSAIYHKVFYHKTQTWSTETDLTGYIENIGIITMESDDNVIAIAWESWLDFPFTYVMVSEDNGVSWSTPFSIGQASSPNIDVENNQVYLTYRDWVITGFPDWLDFMKLEWFDSTMSWSSEYMIPHPATYLFVGAPCVAVDGDEIHVAVADYDSHDIFYYHSFDNGLNWDSYQIITTYYGDMEAKMIDMEAANGIVYFTWSDYRNDHQDIYYIKKDASGWGDEIQVSNSEGISLYPDIEVYSETGNEVHIVWQEEALSGDLSVHYRGLDQTGSVLVNNTYIPDTIGQDSLSPCIAVDDFNGIHIAWVDNRNSNYDIFYLESGVPILEIDDPVAINPMAAPGDPVTFVTVVHNVGPIDVFDVPVKFYAFSEEDLFATVIIDELPAHSSKTISAVWDSIEGEHTIVAAIDMDNTFATSAITDASTPITINVPPSADAVISGDFENVLSQAQIEIQLLIDDSPGTNIEAKLAYAQSHISDALADAESFYYYLAFEDLICAIDDLNAAEILYSGGAPLEINEISYDLTNAVSIKVLSMIEYMVDMFGSEEYHIIEAYSEYNTGLSHLSSEEYILALNALKEAYMGAAFPLDITEVAFVTFQAVNVTDVDGQVISYFWDFGDGSMGIGDIASHLYLVEGNFQVNLTIIDDFGGSNYSLLDISIDVGYGWCNGDMSLNWWYNSVHPWHWQWHTGGSGGGGTPPWWWNVTPPTWWIDAYDQNWDFVVDSSSKVHVVREYYKWEECEWEPGYGELILTIGHQDNQDDDSNWGNITYISNSTHKSMCPQITYDPRTDFMYVFWIEKSLSEAKLLYSTSIDLGESWTVPSFLSNVPLSSNYEMEAIIDGDIEITLTTDSGIVYYYLEPDYDGDLVSDLLDLSPTTYSINNEELDIDNGISTPDGKVSVGIDALIDQTVEINIEETTPAYATSASVGTYYDITTDLTGQFEAYIKMTYDPATLSPTLEEENLRIYYWNGTNWVINANPLLDEETGIDMDLNIVWGKTTHFTEFTIIDASKIDSDDDGIIDSWEVVNGFDPTNFATSTNDFDGDLLTNLEEFIFETSPNLKDSDSDGLDDFKEIYGDFVYSKNIPIDKKFFLWNSETYLDISKYPTGKYKLEFDGIVYANSTTIDLTPDAINCYMVYSNYGNTSINLDASYQDSSVEYYEEIGVQFSGEFTIDSSSNKLWIAANTKIFDTPDEFYITLNSMTLIEIFNPVNILSVSNPNSIDTDSDGISDGYELAAETSVNNPDTDEDGIWDSAEIMYWMTKHGLSMSEAWERTDIRDFDDDKLMDGQEIMFNTLPTDADCDKDGVQDFNELYQYIPIERIDLGYNTANIIQSFYIPTSGNYSIKVTSRSNIGDVPSDCEFYPVNPTLFAASNEPDKREALNLTNNIMENATIFNLYKQSVLVSSTNRSGSAISEYDLGTDGKINETISARYNVIYYELEPGNYQIEMIDIELTDIKLESVKEQLIISKQGLDPFNPDIDEDNLFDGSEINLGSNPYIRDTDGDGLWDGINATGHGEDKNNNGIIDATETDPTKTDSDNDGLWDGFNITVNNIDYIGELSVFTQPYDDDSDDDGLNDGDEFVHSTKPLIWDTDSDTMPDGWEVDYSLNPRYPGDMNNDTETPIADGLTNAQEYSIGTDPTLVDTDSDGIIDGTEINGLKFRTNVEEGAVSSQNYGTAGDWLMLNHESLIDYTYASSETNHAAQEVVQTEPTVYLPSEYSSDFIRNELALELEDGTSVYAQWEGITALTDPVQTLYDDAEVEEINDGRMMAQSFILANKVFSSIKLFPTDDSIVSSGTVTVEVRKDDSGLPGDEIYTSSSFDLATITPPSPISNTVITSGITVPFNEIELTVGDTYWLVLSMVDYASDMKFGAIDSNPYASGDLYYSTTSGVTWEEIDDKDIAFEIISYQDIEYTKVLVWPAGCDFEDSDDSGYLEGTVHIFDKSTSQPTFNVAPQPGYHEQEIYTGSSPLIYDTDNDGLNDYEEINNDADTDGDGLQNNCDMDSDNDGINDGDEIGWDTDSPLDADSYKNMIDSDSDDDGIIDGDETLWYKDIDNDGLEGMVDKDSDGDGLEDGTEDSNHNGITESGETNPISTDTDGDGVIDWVERMRFSFFSSDSDNDGLYNAVDSDSDNDGLIDGLEVRVLVRTNAINLQFNESSWIVANENPFSWHATPNRIENWELSSFMFESQFYCPEGPPGDQFYSVIYDINEEKNIKIYLYNSDVYIYEYDTHYCTKFVNVQVDNAELSIFPVPEYTKNCQEFLVYPILDYEIYLPNVLNPDSDGDLIPDGVEDINGNGLPDNNEANLFKYDTDDDGLSDGDEDLNKNGVCDFGEASPLMTDTDGDGLWDGDEVMGFQFDEYYSQHTTNPANPDSDGDGLWDGFNISDRQGIQRIGELESFLLSNPMDLDSDDDGLFDGYSMLFDDTIYFGELSMNTSSINLDTDGDGLSDGQELGLTQEKIITDEMWLEIQECQATDATIFDYDMDPLTRTNPVDIDTDGDGVSDGWIDDNNDLKWQPTEGEDPNLDGMVNYYKGMKETSPTSLDSDADGISDSSEIQRESYWYSFDGGIEIASVDTSCLSGIYSVMVFVDATNYGSVSITDWFTHSVEVLPGNRWVTLVSELSIYNRELMTMQSSEGISIYSILFAPPLEEILINQQSVELNSTLTIDIPEGYYVKDASLNIAPGYDEFNNGEISGASWDENNAIAGSALLFDGIDDYVSVSDMNLPGDPETKVTVEFWMYWDGGNNQIPFGFDSGETGNPLYSANKYSLWFYDGKFGFKDMNGFVSSIPSTGLDNRWVHVAALFNNGGVHWSKLFIDGVEQELDIYGIHEIYLDQLDDSCRIGYGHNAYIPGIGHAPFSGSIDELRIVYRGLTTEEILDDYQAHGEYPVRSDTKIWYHFDELSGNTILDDPVYPIDVSLSIGEDIIPFWIHNGKLTNNIQVEFLEDVLNCNIDSSNQVILNIKSPYSIYGAYLDEAILSISLEPYISNPVSKDSDEDGLHDWYEMFYYGTNPLSGDTDEDMLNDFQEVQLLGTNPAMRDTDCDGLWDGFQDLDGDETYDPYSEVGEDVNCDYSQDWDETHPLDPDNDNDGLIDGVEKMPGILWFEAENYSAEIIVDPLANGGNGTISLDTTASGSSSLFELESGDWDLSVRVKGTYSEALFHEDFSSGLGSWITTGTVSINDCALYLNGGTAYYTVSPTLDDYIISFDYFYEPATDMDEFMVFSSWDDTDYRDVYIRQTGNNLFINNEVESFCNISPDFWHHFDIYIVSDGTYRIYLNERLVKSGIQWGSGRMTRIGHIGNVVDDMGNNGLGSAYWDNFKITESESVKITVYDSAGISVGEIIEPVKTDYEWLSGPAFHSTGDDYSIIVSGISAENIIIDRWLFAKASYGATVSDALTYDTDNDGLSDGEEREQYYVNPLVRDSDNDGLLDGVEAMEKVGTDPSIPDSEYDCLLDGDAAEIGAIFRTNATIDSDNSLSYNEYTWVGLPDLVWEPNVDLDGDNINEGGYIPTEMSNDLNIYEYDSLYSPIHDFETDDEEFTIMNDQTYSSFEVSNRHVIFNSNRRDIYDEMFVNYFNSPISDADNMWEITARTKITDYSADSRVYPLFISEEGINKLEDGGGITGYRENLILFFFESNHGGPGEEPSISLKARYYDCSGKIYNGISISEIDISMEYYLKARYFNQIITLEIRNENRELIGLWNYEITHEDENKDDGFIFDMYGASCYGSTFVDADPTTGIITGWTDDILYLEQMSLAYQTSDDKNIIYDPVNEWIGVEVSTGKYAIYTPATTLNGESSHRPILSYALNGQEVYRNMALTDDADGDGIIDGLEPEGCSPVDRDSDDDGLMDGYEINILGTDPGNADTDGDGIQDGTECGITAGMVQTGYWMMDTFTFIKGTDMEIFIPDADPSKTTNPINVDSDGDSLDDGVEDVDKNGKVSVNDISESDPSNWDSDGDGLSDSIDPANRDCDYDNDGLWDGPSVNIYLGEQAYGTDNTLWDSDCVEQKLPDGLEVGLTLDRVKVGSALYKGYTVWYTLYDASKVYNTEYYFWPDADDLTTTNPMAPDSDNDGLDDNVEDLNKNGKCDTGETDSCNRDTDGDRIDDGFEVNWNDDTDNDGLINALDMDSDNDGIRDGDEIYKYFTSMINPDHDGDGLLDGKEVYYYQTNPKSTDTDGDTITDDEEIRWGLDPTVDDSGKDSDKDGISNLDEFNYNKEYSSPGSPVFDSGNPDTDGDGIPDLVEYEYSLANAVNDPMDPVEVDGDYDSDGLTNYDEMYNYTTEWLDPDSDGDGLDDGTEVKGRLITIDGVEIRFTSNPLLIHSDSDNVNDSIEYAMGTNASNADTDNDGLLDGWLDNGDGYFDPGEQREVLRGIYNNTEPTTNDTDNDGLEDGIEIEGWYVLTSYIDQVWRLWYPIPIPYKSTEVIDNAAYKVQSNPNENLDNDEDGLFDYEEYLHGCDPVNNDTDGDFIYDGEDIGLYSLDYYENQAIYGNEFVNQPTFKEYIPPRITSYEMEFNIVEYGFSYEHIFLDVYVGTEDNTQSYSEYGVISEGEWKNGISDVKIEVINSGDDVIASYDDLSNNFYGIIDISLAEYATDYTIQVTSTDWNDNEQIYTQTNGAWADFEPLLVDYLKDNGLWGANPPSVIGSGVGLLAGIWYTGVNTICSLGELIEWFSELGTDFLDKLDELSSFLGGLTLEGAIEFIENFIDNIDEMLICPIFERAERASPYEPNNYENTIIDTHGTMGMFWILLHEFMSGDFNLDVYFEYIGIDGDISECSDFSEFMGGYFIGYLIGAVTIYVIEWAVTTGLVDPGLSGITKTLNSIDNLITKAGNWVKKLSARKIMSSIIGGFKKFGNVVAQLPEAIAGLGSRFLDDAFDGFKATRYKMSSWSRATKIMWQTERASIFSIDKVRGMMRLVERYGDDAARVLDDIGPRGDDVLRGFGRNTFDFDSVGPYRLADYMDDYAIKTGRNLIDDLPDNLKAKNMFDPATRLSGNTKAAKQMWFKDSDGGIRTVFDDGRISPQWFESKVDLDHPKGFDGVLSGTDTNDIKNVVSEMDAWKYFNDNEIPMDFLNFKNGGYPDGCTARAMIPIRSGEATQFESKSIKELYNTGYDSGYSTGEKIGRLVNDNPDGCLDNTVNYFQEHYNERYRDEDWIEAVMRGFNDKTETNIAEIGNFIQDGETYYYLRISDGGEWKTIYFNDINVPLP